MSTVVRSLQSLQRKQQGIQVPFKNVSSRNWFSTTRTATPCPWRTLKLEKDATYKAAKQKFFKIAMENHPDVLQQRLDASLPSYQKELKRATEKFMIARTAFESLVEAPDGLCMRRIEAEAVEELMNDEQFDAWFLHETGHSNPFGSLGLDAKTMREVAAATETMGGGLDRDGGMWTLANMVSESVKSGKTASQTLRLEAGVIRDDEVPTEGTLRRRRQTRSRR
jgi:hypothetical protein